MYRIGFLQTIVINKFYTELGHQLQQYKFPTIMVTHEKKNKHLNRHYNRNLIYTTEVLDLYINENFK